MEGKTSTAIPAFGLRGIYHLPRLVVLYLPLICCGALSFRDFYEEDHHRRKHPQNKRKASKPF
jgi:hypothetical protein